MLGVNGVVVDLRRRHIKPNMNMAYFVMRKVYETHITSHDAINSVVIRLFPSKSR